ncbi:MAG: hypothetical protein QF552_13515 [Litorilituus sp.]|jgi:hypothetical protein|nr:hypothetical protein [Litorilituus sp.]
MKKVKLLTLLTLCFIVTQCSYAQESTKVKIKRAMSAAPSSISADATIMDNDGTILRKGSNGWTCLPNVLSGDMKPICNDATWMEMLAALGKKEHFETDRIGISYMLVGDIGAGVSNSTPYHEDHKNAEDYVETGPHLMIIVPKEQLTGLTRDPKKGGPYVMWGDTPYAHIMIPIDESKVLMKNHKQ